MLEPAAPSRLSVVALAALSFALSACQRQPETPPPTAPKAVQVPAVTLPTPPPPELSRADLLQAMDAAATAYAAGTDPESDGFAGRRFVIRQAFGCSGPSSTPEDPADGLARWTWRNEGQEIELSLTPGDWKSSSLASGSAADWEAVEGVWLPQPWLRAEGCPAIQGGDLADGRQAPSPQTAGLAMVFESGGSRLGRRKGRAYSFVVRGKDGQPAAPPDGGYRVVLEGRLTSFADGRAIHCRAPGPDQRPVCVAAARLDRLAFEDADGALLSEWRAG